MKQVVEIITLLRRTLLSLEVRGEFPLLVQLTEGRKAWYLSEGLIMSREAPRCAWRPRQKSPTRCYASRWSVCTDGRVKDEASTLVDD